MRGLEEGLRVADIAVFDLLTCEPTDRIADVLSRVARFDFDNVPVRDGECVIGVVEDIKRQSPAAEVEDVRAPLAESMLVAGSTSLRAFLPRIADRPYRLVVSEGGIAGVVTPSDVVQLPVRLLVFALIAHLEEVMRAAIRETQPDDERTVEKLGARRLENVQTTLRRQKKKGLNPAPLDVTQFIDKANLLFDLPVVTEKEGDRAMFTQFYELRNKVDHVDRYAETPEKLSAFLQHIEELEMWIDRLTDLLPPDTPAATSSSGSRP
jgi:hypothetical protein